MRLCVVALLLCGCSWQPPLIAEEAVQQAAQVVDLDQTLNLRHTGHCTYGTPGQWSGSAWDGTLHQVRPQVCTPAMQEVMAAPIIGKHPSDAQVYQFKAAEMALHAGVTELLEAKHFSTAVQIWEITTIGVQAAVDAHNAAIGVGLRYGL